MNHQNLLSKRLMMQGVLFGNLFAFFASFLFAVADGIAIQVNSINIGIQESFNLDFVFYSLMGFTCAIGFIIAILPASFGGVHLARIISKNHEESLSYKKAFGIGARIGGLSGFIICIPIILIALSIYLSHGANLISFLIRSIEAISLSLLAGGFTSTILARQWKRIISSSLVESQ